MHSKYSTDCLIDPRKIAKIAERRNLTGIAIVDHNTIRGGLMTRKVCKTFVKVIVGSEVLTNAGDIVGLFLTEEIESFDALEVIAEIKGQGGVSVLPHPFKGRRLGVHEFKDICRSVDAVEGINSRCPTDAQTLDCLKSLGKPIVAGSDAHFLCEIGQSRTMIMVESDELEDVKRAILKGKVQISGVPSPTYLQPISQVIKSIKTRNCADFLLSSASLPMYFLRDVHNRSILST